MSGRWEESPPFSHVEMSDTLNVDGDQAAEPHLRSTHTLSNPP